jgi:hypothetical protein
MTMDTFGFRQRSKKMIWDPSFLSTNFLFSSFLLIRKQSCRLAAPAWDSI